MVILWCAVVKRTTNEFEDNWNPRHDDCKEASLLKKVELVARITSIKKKLLRATVPHRHTHTPSDTLRCQTPSFLHWRLTLFEINVNVWKVGSYKNMWKRIHLQIRVETSSAAAAVVKPHCRPIRQVTNADFRAEPDVNFIYYEGTK